MKQQDKNKRFFEYDRPYNSQTEHLGSLFARVRYQSWIIGLSWIVVVIMGFFLYRLGASPLVRVYEISPNGEATYVGTRQALYQSKPSEKEVLHVAKRFVGLYYDYNSSKIAENLTHAANMCSPSLQQSIIEQTAKSKFIGRIEAQRMRTEIRWDIAKIINQTDALFTVLVTGTKYFFPIDMQAEAPIGEEAFAISLVLENIPREPIYFPNGLQIIRAEIADPSKLASIRNDKI